jgi:Contractile injection system tube protein
MASQFPHSPRVLKGGLVAYRLPALAPTVITFQYNPDEVSRSLQTQAASAGTGRGEANRLNGPPQETLTLSVEIDATDQLEAPGENAITVEHGLHPVIASLERLIYPSYPVVAINEALALAGTAFINNENAPLTLLVWGPRRVVPVQVQSLSIKEEAFDQNLNPIRAKADLSLRVLTYRDLDVTNPGYWVYLAAFTQKEVLSAMNPYADSGGLAILGRL